MLEFRVLNAQNYHASFAIHQQSQPNAWSEKVFIDCLQNNYFAYAAYENGILLGYCIGMSVCDESTLIDIAVHPQKRGRGHGQKLLDWFIQCSEDKQATHIWLEVRAGNKAAIDMYYKANFVVVETRQDYYPSSSGKPNKKEDALIMCRMG